MKHRMDRLLDHLLARLALLACLGHAPAALADCPGDPGCSLSLGIELTLDTHLQLGTDLYANWSLETGHLGTAPVTLGVALTAPFSLSDGFELQPPAGNLHIQVTPTVAGYPLDIGLAMVYRYRRYLELDYAYEAYVGPLRISTRDTEWTATVTLVDIRWWGAGFVPPPNFVPTFQWAELTVAAVPEPGAASLGVVGLALVLLAARRRYAKPFISANP